MAVHKKRNPWPGRVAALGILALSAQVLAAPALADTIDLDGKNGVAGATFGPAGGSAGFYVKLIAKDGSGATPDINGCNASPTLPTTVTFSVGADVDWLDVPAPVTLTGCADIDAVHVSVGIHADAQTNGSAQLFGQGSGGAVDIQVAAPGNAGTTVTASSEYKTGLITVHVRDDAAAATCTASNTPAAPVWSPLGSSSAWVNALPSPAPSATTTTAGATVRYDDGTGAYAGTSPPALVEGVNTLNALSVLGDCVSSSASATYQVDLTDPSISGSVSPLTPDGDAGWYRSAPTVSFTCADDPVAPVTQTSGVATCLADGVTPASPGKTLGESDAAQTVDGTAVDNAGNTSHASVTGLHVDLSNPTVSFAPAPTFVLGAPAPTCSGTDAISGFNSCVVTGFDSSTFTGSTTRTMTATAKDNAGNTATASRTYTVAGYGVSAGGCPGGIRPPISCDNTSVFSRGKAVPVKFGLLYDETSTIPVGGTTPVGFATGNWTLVAQPMDCRTSTPTTAAVAAQILQSAKTGFRYDAAGDQYVFNADMSTQPVGSCWRFVATIAPGQAMTSAVFKLQK